MPAPIVNLRDVPRERMAHGERFEASVGRVGSWLGAQQLGCSIVEVPPGKRACPFHTHHSVDELFVILEGTGTLRLGSESLPIEADDVISSPAGDLPHQIVNTSRSTLRFLCISTIAETDVADYPDSGKVGIAVGRGVLAPPRMSFLRDGREVDYWDGEQ